MVETNKENNNLIVEKRSLFPCFRRVAQFGSALRSGRRGRRFKSCYADRGAETTRGRSRLRVLSRRGVWRHWMVRWVCGWRLGVCSRALSVLVSKLGPVWVGRLRVSAHAGWAGRWRGWCACVPPVGRTVVAWLLLVFVSAPLFLLPVWWNGRHARLKSGCPVGRAGSTPATGTGTTQNA